MGEYKIFGERFDHSIIQPTGKLQTLCSTDITELRNITTKISGFRIIDLKSPIELLLLLLLLFSRAEIADGRYRKETAVMRITHHHQLLLVSRVGGTALMIINEFDIEDSTGNRSLW